MFHHSFTNLFIVPKQWPSSIHCTKLFPFFLGTLKCKSSPLGPPHLMAGIKKNNDKMNLLHAKNLTNGLNEHFQIIFTCNSLQACPKVLKAGGATLSIFYKQRFKWKTGWQFFNFFYCCLILPIKFWGSLLIWDFKKL